jgi:asparagine N-glycosylation enzyme membrane subunit Stt3
MCNRKKQNLKMVPTFLVVALLVISGGLKISGHHPMILHFVQLGIDGLLPLLGSAEILFALLLLFPLTSKLGVLLLTAYFGGAMAIELPYHMVAAPAAPLILIWVAAFIRQRSLFFETKRNSTIPQTQFT